MITLGETEQAIEQLQPRELERLATLVSQRLNAQWDRQMESDSATGKLDFLFEEAARERNEGKLRDWPSSQS